MEMGTHDDRTGTRGEPSLTAVSSPVTESLLSGDVLGLEKTIISGPNSSARSVRVGNPLVLVVRKGTV